MCNEKLTHFYEHKYLVAYDIRKSKRLQRMFKRLKDFGMPIQKSVFECLLSGKQVEDMWKMVQYTIDDTEDWVVLFRLNQPHNEAIRHIGYYDPQHLHKDDVIFI